MADLLFPILQAETLRKNRWILRFPNDIGIQPFMLKSCSGIKPSQTKITIPFLNTEVYGFGRLSWAPIQIVIRDFVSPSSRQALVEFFRLHSESVTGRQGYMVGAAKNLNLELLDPTGVKVGEWLIENAILVDEIDFGALDYSEDGLLEISFSVQPQKCINLY